MKYCPYCGKRINASVKFCPYCGKPQPQNSTSAQPSQMTDIRSSRSSLNVIYFALITMVLSALFYVYSYNRIVSDNAYAAYLYISNNELIIFILAILNIVACSLDLLSLINGFYQL